MFILFFEMKMQIEKPSGFLKIFLKIIWAEKQFVYPHILSDYVSKFGILIKSICIIFSVYFGITSAQ